jgi:hypothetical protein
MKTLILLIALSSSFTAFADFSQCKGLYNAHEERLNLLKALALEDTISVEFKEERLKDEFEIMKISVPVMCSNLSHEEKKEIRHLTMKKAEF